MRSSVRAAFCGILTALATVFMLLVPVIPVMLYCSPILSGICVAIAAEEFGGRYAFGVYLAASILSILLVADKEAVSVFVLLAGAYPVLKYALDHAKRQFIGKFAVKLAVKLIYINAACAAYFLSAVLLLGVPRESFGSSLMLFVFLLLGNIIMLAYDKAIDGMTAVYKIKFRGYILKGKR